MMPRNRHTLPHTGTGGIPGHDVPGSSHGDGSGAHTAHIGQALAAYVAIGVSVVAVACVFALCVAVCVAVLYVIVCGIVGA